MNSARIGKILSFVLLFLWCASSCLCWQQNAETSERPWPVWDSHSRCSYDGPHPEETFCVPRHIDFKYKMSLVRPYFIWVQNWVLVCPAAWKAEAEGLLEPTSSPLVWEHSQTWYLRAFEKVLNALSFLCFEMGSHVSQQSSLEFV